MCWVAGVAAMLSFMHNEAAMSFHCYRCRYATSSTATAGLPSAMEQLSGGR